MAEPNYPVDLVLVRHGESESNFAQSKSKQGDDSSWTPEFKARHTSHYRLTSVGQEQARIAGEWIRQNIAPSFDRYYCSEYIRAIETAALLDFPGAKWDTDVFLREQDIGQFTGASHIDRATLFADEMKRAKRDAFYFRAPGGESIAQCTERVENWLAELQRTTSGLRVLAVCHGNILKSIFIRLERMMQTDWYKFQTDEYYKTFNCQVIHFSRRNPYTSQIHSKFCWVKSVCPVNLANSKNEWRRIKRCEMTNEELLAIVESTPRAIEDEDFEKITAKSDPEKVAEIYRNMTMSYG